MRNSEYHFELAVAAIRKITLLTYFASALSFP
jgi:hypothetical protein